MKTEIIRLFQLKSTLSATKVPEFGGNVGCPKAVPRVLSFWMQKHVDRKGSLYPFSAPPFFNGVFFDTTKIENDRFWTKINNFRSSSILTSNLINFQDLGGRYFIWVFKPP